MILEELKVVSKYASELCVSHSKVASMANVSYNYARQLRNAKTSTAQTQKTMQLLIDCYRKEIQRKKLILRELL